MSASYKIKTRPSTIPANSSIRLPVSMGSAAHTGMPFLALCHWAERQFKDITLIIADTLQAHNMGGDRNAARRLGDDWLKENNHALSTLSNATITRWDDWLGCHSFDQTLGRVQSLYAEDEFFKSTIDSGVNRFLKKRISSDLGQEWARASKNLLLEEAAVILMDFRDAIEIYPGTVPALNALGTHTKIKLIRVDVSPVTI